MDKTPFEAKKLVSRMVENSNIFSSRVVKSSSIHNDTFLKEQVNLLVSFVNGEVPKVVT